MYDADWYACAGACVCAWAGEYDEQLSSVEGVVVSHIVSHSHFVCVCRYVALAVCASLQT